MSEMSSANTLKQKADFTSGSLFKSILIFSLPLMASQILQVLFNISDVIIVGKGLEDSTIPVGAVGSTSTLLTLFTGFLIGLGSGVNVITARYLGANKARDIKETVDTSLILSLITGILLFAICFFFAKPILELLKTKPELIDKATLYLKIYSCGMPAMAIFNYGNGILSASGDTRRPLVYLTVSGLLNICLNLFFVLFCHLDVEGVALASIITQYLSAVAIIIRLTSVKDVYKLDFKTFVFNKSKAANVLELGLPAGIQNGIFAFANIFIQIGINSFEYKVVTGITTSQNIDTVVFNVMAAFYTACSTFMGQNYGAGKKSRVLQSYFITMLYGFSAGLILGLFAVFKGDVILRLFDTDPEVVAAGMDKLKIMGLFYCLGAFMDNTIAASRGIGKTLIPTIIVILGSCIFRIVWIYTIFEHYRTIFSLFLLYPISWIITSIAEMIYFFISFKRLNL